MDGVEELQTGGFTAGLAGAYLHGLATLGNAEDGVADDACVVESPSPSVDGERVVGEVVLDGVLKTKVVDDFRGQAVVEVCLGVALLRHAGQKQRGCSEEEGKGSKVCLTHREIVD